VASPLPAIGIYNWLPNPFRSGSTLRNLHKEIHNLRSEGETASPTLAAPYDRLRSDPVTTACRLTGDDHANRLCASIQRLMLLAWGNLDSFT
jgi:hypothetical protein